MAKSKNSTSILADADIKKLVGLIDSSDLQEIVIENESSGLHFALRKTEQLTPEAQTAALQEESPMDVDAPASAEYKPITSPLVGIFRSIHPEKNTPYVSDGTVIHEGQRVGNIEALGVMNEVEATFAGKIIEIKVEDGQAVEYGQVLMLVDVK